MDCEKQLVFYCEDDGESEFIVISVIVCVFNDFIKIISNPKLI